MRVFVAGASGEIGSRLVRRLVARGHEVTGTTHRRDRLDRIRALGADAVLVDGIDATGVGEAVARAEPDAIVHEMTALTVAPDMRHFDRWFAGTNALRTRGTENLLAAANAVGARRFVAQSYTGWTNARDGAWVKTEDDALDAQPAKEQTRTLEAIRFLERSVLDSPSEGIVLRYANLYGPGTLDPYLELLRRRQLPIIGSGAGMWSWLNLDDAADATVAALETGRPGIYNVADDDPATAAEWIGHLARLGGARPPMRLPAWLGRILAGEAAARWMTEGRAVSNAKAKRELGWSPVYPTWREGFGAALATPSEEAAVSRHEAAA